RPLLLLLLPSSPTPPAPSSAPPASASPAVMTATAAAILWGVFIAGAAALTGDDVVDCGINRMHGGALIGRVERLDGLLLLLELRLRHAGRRQVRRNKGNIALWRNHRRISAFVRNDRRNDGGPKTLSNNGKHTLPWNGSHIFSQLIHSSDYSSQFSLTVVYITLQPFVQSSHVSHQLSLLVDSSELSQSIFLLRYQSNLHQRVEYWW
ncbi:hypothetical protein B0H14DRAFT_2755289, partial [Mycena olivaceomarginata]